MNNRLNRNLILWYDTMIVSLLKTQIIKLKKNDIVYYVIVLI